MPFDIPYQVPAEDLEILVDARARISDKNSWVKRRFHDGNGYCLIGALSLACGSRGFNVTNQTERRLTQLLAKQLEPSPSWGIRLLPARFRLISYNDHPGTSHDDVMALFDRTISCLAISAFMETHA
jgi:hypothetical protein